MYWMEWFWLLTLISVFICWAFIHWATKKD